MTHEQRKAILAGLLAAGLLGLAIFVGSRNLRHIDAALVGYTFASLFAAFGLGYRYSMWLQRPPTRMYWQRGWQSFLRPGHLAGSLKGFVTRFVSVFMLNRFIWRRSRSRGLTHMLIMWGCILAAAITFPLVFGWIYFETVPGDLTRYEVFVFGLPVFAFPHESLIGHLIFHGLVWSSFLVIAGVLMALHRRLRDHGAAALQDLQEDILPLFMLFAVSVTGLLLTVSYTWLKGYAYEFLAITHAVTVIFTLLWLPFGKFFHIFQRPAQLGVKFYKDVGAESEQAKCARCQQPYATRLHIEDLIVVERELGYQYDWPDNPAGHYQRISLGIWRHLIHRVPLTYEHGFWAAVFPLGMYTVCTQNLIRVFQLPFLETISTAFVWIASLAWALTFAGLTWHVTKLISARASLA